jgi:hypothetical protein
VEPIDRWIARVAVAPVDAQPQERREDIAEELAGGPTVEHEREDRQVLGDVVEVGVTDRADINS